MIKERYEIKKNNQRKGTIDVKIFWHDENDKNSGDLLKS